MAQIFPRELKVITKNKITKDNNMRSLEHLDNGAYHIVYMNNSEAWYNAQGELHRTDGPARILGKTKVEEYFINGVKVDKLEAKSEKKVDRTKREDKDKA